MAECSSALRTGISAASSLPASPGLSAADYWHLALGEHPVAKGTELGEGAGGALGVGLEPESLGVGGRPGHGGMTHDQLAAGTGSGDGSTTCYRAAPDDVETTHGRNRGGGLEPEQRVRDVEKVLDLEVGRRHPGFTGPELNLDWGRQGNGPEQAARIRVDAGIEIVNLG